MPASLLRCFSSASSKYYAYIHRNEIQLIDPKGVVLGNDKSDAARAAYGEKDLLSCIDFVRLAMGELLVALTHTGCVHIMDDSGSKLLHSYRHTKSGGASLSSKEAYFRGIAADGKETLYVGTGSGDILVLSCTKSKLSLLKVVSDVHSESSATSGGVSALTYVARESMLVSADDYGNVAFWPGASGAEMPAAKVSKVAGFGAPVTALASGHGCVVASYATGQLRIYSAATRSLSVEIGAHTRAINGLEIHASRPIVMAASEDTFVSVWSLPTSAQPQIRQLMCESPVLGLLTGARFGGQNQELIITTTYDSRALAIMHTP